MGESTESFTYRPIGHVRSVFEGKSGTPRQSGLSSYARASLTINRVHFNNPDHALKGLEGFSHVWLLWVFHADSGVAIKAKVAPPRLGGVRVGVFSTRSPHRPANIGLTLAKVEGVEGDRVLLSGVDLIDGTPVLDIKPYIPAYDSSSRGSEDGKEIFEEVTEAAQNAREVIENVTGDRECEAVGEEKHRANLLNFVSWAIKEPREAESDTTKEPREAESDTTKEPREAESGGDRVEITKKQRTETEDSVRVSHSNEKSGEVCPGRPSTTVVRTEVRVPDWIANPEADLVVAFSSRAEVDLQTIDLTSCQWLKTPQELRGLVTDMMRADPRSVYRKNRGSDRLYFTVVDTVHITAWYDDSLGGMEVLRLRNDAPPPPHREDDKKLQLLQQQHVRKARPSDLCGQEEGEADLGQQ